MAETSVTDMETLPPRYLDILNHTIPNHPTTILPLYHFRIIGLDYEEHHTVEGIVYWRHHSEVHSRELLDDHAYVFNNTRMICVNGPGIIHEDDVRIVKNVSLMGLANVHVANIQSLTPREPHKGWNDPNLCPVLQLSIVFDSRIHFHIVG